MFCVLFGLSMDYQVFLLSRVRERFDLVGDTREAVGFGIQSTAGIITGAALIMVAVFVGLASGQLVMFQQIGFGLAVAVFLDATVVRTVVAPATIALIGDRYWWLPRWLSWLPRVNMGERDMGGDGDQLAGL
jgi:RND superfamily putative drug exporter